MMRWLIYRANSVLTVVQGNVSIPCVTVTSPGNLVTDLPDG
jgi:hypothetical protein